LKVFNLKIHWGVISVVCDTNNGKSPTLAKRIRQFLEELLPEEINDLLDNLQAYRKTITGDFEFKVHEMN